MDRERSDGQDRPELQKQPHRNTIYLAISVSIILALIIVPLLIVYGAQITVTALSWVNGTEKDPITLTRSISAAGIMERGDGQDGSEPSTEPPPLPDPKFKVGELVQWVEADYPDQGRIRSSQYDGEWFYSVSASSGLDNLTLAEDRLSSPAVRLPAVEPTPTATPTPDPNATPNTTSPRRYNLNDLAGC
jgi:hypothetical protein